MKSIAAISTPAGTGGIALIRLSGDDAFEIADRIWKGTPLSQLPSHTVRLGIITDSDGELLDQAVATVYAEGKSFTGEPTVEFSVHGSGWIQRRVLERLIEAGASAAGPGEFTRRAFINGRMDLAQAEAVADMIASSSKAAQRLAATQMKGTFSRRLNDLRDSMIQLASLLELELDFSEEDVEFADRTHLLELTRTTHEEISRLASSFSTGRALKEGVAVVIAGAPNAGKSTLLNCLLQDEKAIISDIPGTTRDIIEDTAEINGILFRFIDTAGLRDTDDRIEKIGVERARQAIEKADIILHLIDSTSSEAELISADNLPFKINPSAKLLTIYTKADLTPILPSETNSPASTVTLQDVNPIDRHLVPTSDQQKSYGNPVRSELCDFSGNNSSENDSTASSSENIDTPNDCIIPSDHESIRHPEGKVRIDEKITISAKTGAGIPQLLNRLTEIANGGCDNSQDMIVTNVRHYESLLRAADSLQRVTEALQTQLPADLIAQDLREAIHHLASITGAITSTDLLQSIFSRFCIGK